MTTEQWREYLHYCSAELLKYPGIREQQSELVLTSGWMGYEAATERQIREAEKRLGVEWLPPSLRDFYLVSNGWRHISGFIHDILPVEHIGWVKDILPDLWTPSEYAEDAFACSTDVYERMFIYNQHVRVNRSLVVSQEGDSANLLLDPYVQFDYAEGLGEWAGGRWASWNPAMRWTSRSFVELFQDEFDVFLQLRDYKGD
jgi:hypothetical protein